MTANPLDLLNPAQIDALDRTVRRLAVERPGGKVRLASLALEVAAVPSDAIHLVGLDHAPVGIGPPHPALEYARMIDAPPHLIRWFETHSSADPAPSWDWQGLAYRQTGERWPEHDAAPQRRAAPEGRDAPAGHSDPGDGSRPYSASPAALPPLVRRFLTS